MHLAVTSLAWNDDEKEMFSHLRRCGISNIEVVFSKIRPWNELTDQDIFDYKQKLIGIGLSAISTQSLFYGIQTNLTETETVLEHFKRLIRYCEILEIRTMVFGSPGMRKGDPSANKELFYKIDELLNNKNLSLVIEPNARIYGGEYWHTIPEIVQFLGNNYKNVHTMIDTHNLVLEERSIVNDLVEFFDKIKHIHLSEPKLAVTSNFENVSEFIQNLQRMRYAGSITYEVLAAEGIYDSILQFSKILSK